MDPELMMQLIEEVLGVKSRGKAVGSRTPSQASRDRMQSARDGDKYDSYVHFLYDLMSQGVGGVLSPLVPDWRTVPGQASPHVLHDRTYDVEPKFTDDPFTRAYPLVPSLPQRPTGFGGPPVGAPPARLPVRPEFPETRPIYPVGPPSPLPPDPSEFRDAEGNYQPHDGSYHPDESYYDTVPDPVLQDAVNLVARRRVPRPALMQDTRSFEGGGDAVVDFLRQMQRSGLQ